jgi:hypothetical protein
MDQEEQKVIEEMDKLANSYLLKLFKDAPDCLFWLGKNHVDLPTGTFLNSTVGDA